MRKLCLALAVLAIALPDAALAGNFRAGKKVYDKHCVICHGAIGVAAMPGVPSFKKGERLDRPDPVLQNAIRDGKAVMPAWGGILNHEQIRDVVAYVRTLQR
jgi:cytochrome c6